MKSVLLRLEGPMQSWGTQGRFGIRDTEREPSKSGVLGLVGAALGMPREDAKTLARLCSLSMAVRIDREGTWMRDYHTVGGGRFRGRRHGIGGESGDTALTERHYLADASFLVALSGDDALVDQIATALANPVWPLFLGRKSCVPATPVFAGLADVAAVEALESAPYPLIRDGEERPERVRLVIECGPGEGDPRQDLPESFALYSRRHGVRFVRTEHRQRADKTNDKPIAEEAT